MLISSLSHNPPPRQLSEVGVWIYSSVRELKSDIPSVGHTSEIPFVYGVPPDNSTSAITLSRIMIEYWVSFATSLDPNDGRGISRTSFFPCTFHLFGWLWPGFRSTLGWIHERPTGKWRHPHTPPCIVSYSYPAQEVMQLNGNDLKMIPDDYRAKQIDYINSIPWIFHHRRWAYIVMTRFMLYIAATGRHWLRQLCVRPEFEKETPLSTEPSSHIILAVSAVCMCIWGKQPWKEMSRFDSSIVLQGEYIRSILTAFEST